MVLTDQPDLDVSLRSEGGLHQPGTVLRVFAHFRRQDGAVLTGFKPSRAIECSWPSVEGGPVQGDGEGCRLPDLLVPRHSDVFNCCLELPGSNLSASFRLQVSRPPPDAVLVLLQTTQVEAGGCVRGTVSVVDAAGESTDVGTDSMLRFEWKDCRAADALDRRQYDRKSQGAFKIRVLGGVGTANLVAVVDTSTQQGCCTLRSEPVSFSIVPGVPYSCRVLFSQTALPPQVLVHARIAELCTREYQTCANTRVRAHAQL